MLSHDNSRAIDLCSGRREGRDKVFPLTYLPRAAHEQFLNREVAEPNEPGGTVILKVHLVLIKQLLSAFAS